MKVRKFGRISDYVCIDSPNLVSFCCLPSPDGACIYISLPESRTLQPYSSTSVVTDVGLCDSAPSSADIVVTKSHLGDSLLVSVSDYFDDRVFPLTVTVTNMSGVPKDLLKGLLLAVVVDVRVTLPKVPTYPVLTACIS